MLIDIETASPPFKVNQQFAASELKKRMGGSPAVARMIEMAANQSGIDHRYFVIPDGDENASDKFFTKDGNHYSPDTKTRMNEYEKWAVLLAVNAVNKLGESNRINFSTINRIITISCTGFFAPGLDYQIIKEFNLPLNVKRTNIGFMGCAASLVGINSVWEAMKQDENENILMISVELCSLHLQTEPTRDNILANMIFADGAAAAFFSKNNYLLKRKLEIQFAESFMFEDSAKYMGWKIGNNGFEMMLSSELPKIILNNGAPKAKEILAKRGIDISKIKHWALHPGGRAILDSLQNGLQLSDRQLKPSRDILKNFGNLSSVSILFVLKNILENEQLDIDDLCCAVAFGPGLTMELVLFKVC
ncbi:MAG: type III polyketide synthase [Ignavibacteriales bacterium]|nr:type III polyketide synthase [Ignavibacteriales bacterium]